MDCVNDVNSAMLDFDSHAESGLSTHSDTLSSDTLKYSKFERRLARSRFFFFFSYNMYLLESKPPSMSFDQLTPHKLFCALLIREFALVSHADSSVAEDECVPICDLTRVLVHEAVPEPTSDVQLCFEPPLAHFADSARAKLGRRSMQLVDPSIQKVRCSQLIICFDFDNPQS
jgi:hypothetical protein